MGGTYSLDEADSCIQCDPGYYQSEPGHSSCDPCAAGTYADGYGTVTCTECLAGYFNNEPNSTSCEPCPAGSASFDSGSTSCALCEPGYYMPDEGRTFCLPCPAGTYGEASGLTECTICPAGYNCGLEAAAISITPCSAGTFSGNDDLACEQCPDGEISEDQATSCEACDWRSYASDKQDECKSCLDPSIALGFQKPRECFVTWAGVGALLGLCFCFCLQGYCTSRLCKDKGFDDEDGAIPEDILKGDSLNPNKATSVEDVGIQMTEPSTSSKKERSPEKNFASINPREGDQTTGDMGTPLIDTSASPAVANVTEATSVGLPRKHRKKRAAKSHGNAVWVDKADEESQPNEGDNITAQSLSPIKDMTGAQIPDSPAVGSIHCQTEE